MGPNFVLDKGFLATGAVEQFRVVELVTHESVQRTNALGDAAIGVCQEGDVTAGDATNGRVIAIRILGITRVVAAAAITLGAPVRADATGKVTTLAAATANQNVVGIAMTAATADGDHIDLLLTPGTQRST